MSAIQLHSQYGPEDTERNARAYLTSFATPGDSVLTALIDMIGAEETVNWLHERHPEDPVDIESRKPGVWKSLHKRYQVPISNAPDMEQEHSQGSAAGARVIIPNEATWPQHLNDLEASPIALWQAGPTHLGSAVCISGSRASSPYAAEATQWIAEELAKNGMHIITSAGYGISETVIKTAIKAAPYNCRVTVVMGSGVASPHPRAHKQLLDDLLAAGGTVISEVSPTRSPSRLNFLESNRIMAAMAEQTVIIEASMRSRSIGLATQARDLNKLLWAVPGRIIDTSAAGTNALIASGEARLLTRDLTPFDGHGLCCLLV